MSSRGLVAVGKGLEEKEKAWKDEGMEGGTEGKALLTVPPVG